MSQVLIFDRAMCCPTGVCGPQVDNVLPTFAADLDWLAQQGHQVQRFNLAQDAGEFANSETAQSMLQSHGVECLPLVVVDGQVVSQGDYPSRANLALWTNTPVHPANALPLSQSGQGCCGDSGCC